MMNETHKKMKKSNVVSTPQVQTGKIGNVGITSQGGGVVRSLTTKEVAIQSQLINR